MPVVEARKNVHIIQPMTVGGDPTSSFQYEINVDFIPDEAFTRIENYYNSTEVIEDTQVLFVYTNLVSGYIGSTRTQPVFRGAELKWQLHTPVRGFYNFQIQNASRQPLTLNGDLHIILEFVKYKQKGKLL